MPSRKATYQWALLSIAALAFSNQSFTNKKEKMKIQATQTAPGFSVKDVNGTNINLSDYRGKKVLLSFYRNAGCPVCNLRFHELQEQAGYFKLKNLVLVAVYESSAVNLKKYLEGESVYATMIPNPELNLYKQYAVEQSGIKLMKGLFHGAMSKMKQGKKLYKTEIKQDGNANRISADFLIDENGVVSIAYYGQYVGDHLPIEELKHRLK